jgi:hypothetical protein
MLRPGTGAMDRWHPSETSARPPYAHAGLGYDMCCASCALEDDGPLPAHEEETSRDPHTPVDCNLPVTYL